MPNRALAAKAERARREHIEAGKQYAIKKMIDWRHVPSKAELRAQIEQVMRLARVADAHISTIPGAKRGPACEYGRFTRYGKAGTYVR